jgi:hypothetical protein
MKGLRFDQQANRRGKNEVNFYFEKGNCDLKFFWIKKKNDFE